MTERLDAIVSPAQVADEWASRVRTRDPLGTVDASSFPAIVDGLVRHLVDGAELPDVEPAHLAVDHLTVLREVVHDRIVEVDASAVDVLAEVDRGIDSLILDCVHGRIRNLEADAYADPLTGVGNRRALERDLHMSLAQVERYEHALSVVMIDIDGLKAVNDVEGHEAGDALIQNVASSCVSQLRRGDGLYRVGGDEFVAVLLHADQAAAASFLERARAVAPAFSYGVATAPGDGTDAAGILDAADQRLLAQRGPRRRRPKAAAPTPGPAVKPSTSGDDLVVASVTTTFDDNATSIEVSVRRGALERTGRAIGPASGAEPHLAATATLDAIRQFGSDVSAMHIDTAALVPAGMHDVVTVVLVSSMGDAQVVAAGSAVIRRGIGDAAARAVVQAIAPRMPSRQIIQI